MATAVGGESVGGAERSSEAVLGAAEAAMLVAQQIVKMAVGDEGRLDPSAASLMGMRTHPERDIQLRRLLTDIRPFEANPQLWMRWLGGGSHPFDTSALKRIDAPGGVPARQIERSSDRVATCDKKIDRLRRQLDEAERQREEMVSLDRGIVIWAIEQRIADLMAPIFAMGPAWVLMRIVSAFVDPDEMKLETVGVTDPAKLKWLSDSIERDRVEKSRKILDALDLWGGDFDFERDVRDAIAGAVRRYEGRELDRAKAGVRGRSPTEMKTRVQPGTAGDKASRIGVLSGVARMYKGGAENEH